MSLLRHDTSWKKRAKQGTAAAALVLTLGQQIACGGPGKKKEDSNVTPPSTVTQLDGMVEIGGMVAGADIVIKDMQDRVGYITRSNDAGKFRIDMNEVRKKLGDNVALYKIETSNGKDLDPDGNGKIDTDSVTVQGKVTAILRAEDIGSSMVQLTPFSSYIEKNISSPTTLTKEELDAHARSLSIGDINLDGVVDYRDVLAYRMTGSTGTERSMIMDSYAPVLYTNTQNTEASDFELFQKISTNLVTVRVLPDADLDTVIRLEKSSNAVNILYTTDGSIPTKNSTAYQTGKTFSSTDGIITYCEVFSDGTLGGTKTLDLQHDIITEVLNSQKDESVDRNDKSLTRQESGNGMYELFARYDFLSVGKKYPAQLYITIEPKSGYSGEKKFSRSIFVFDDGYRDAMQTRLISKAKDQITIENYQGTTTVHKPNEIIADATVSYNGGDYTVKVQYNRKGTNQDYPVLVWASYHTKSGASEIDTAKIEISNPSDLANTKLTVINQAKSAIDVTHNEPRESKDGPYTYGKGDYTTYVIYNYKKTNSDYPAEVRVEYNTQTGVSGTWGTTSRIEVADVTIKESTKANLVTKAKQAIDQGNSSNEPRTTMNGPIAYNGGDYTQYVVYNYKKTNSDYPATVHVEYHEKNQSNTLKQTQTVEVANLSEKENQKNILTAYAQGQIDQSAVNAPNTQKQDGPYTYGKGDYTIYALYNHTGTNRDYPVQVWVEYHTNSSNSSSWASTSKQDVSSESEKESLKQSLVTQVKSAIDAANVQQPQTIPYGPYTYRGGDYTAYNKIYKNGSKFPTDVWAEFHYYAGDPTLQQISMMTANSESDLTSLTNSVKSTATSKIDAFMNANTKTHSVNQETSAGIISYNGGDYEIWAKYNRVGTGYDYPALVWVNYHLKGKTTLYSTSRYTVYTPSEKDAKKSELESAVRKAIDTGTKTSMMIVDDVTDQTDKVLASTQVLEATIAAPATVGDMWFGGTNLKPIISPITGLPGTQIGNVVYYTNGMTEYPAIATAKCLDPKFTIRSSTQISSVGELDQKKDKVTFDAKTKLLIDKYQLIDAKSLKIKFKDIAGQARNISDTMKLVGKKWVALFLSNAEVLAGRTIGFDISAMLMYNYIYGVPGAKLTFSSDSMVSQKIRESTWWKNVETNVINVAKERGMEYYDTGRKSEVLDGDYYVQIFGKNRLIHGDFFFSLHQVDYQITVSYDKSNAAWRVKTRIYDKYDWEKLGIFLNDQNFFLQEQKILTPFDIEIQMEDLISK